MIRARRNRLLTLVATAALIASFAAPAYAAAPAPKAPPGTTDVQIWPEAEPGRNVSVVSVTVPSETKLPVTIRVPIPPDAQVVWAGEILGGDPAQDPKRDFKVVNGVGGTVAEFELSEARTGQIEAVGGPIAQKAGVYTVDTRWVQSAPSKLTGLSVRLPAGAASVQTTPAASGPPDKNQSGESLYQLPSRNFKTGEGETVTVSWKVVPVASTQGGQKSGGTNPVPIIVGLLAGAVVVLAVVLFAQRGRSSSAEDQPASDDDAAGDDEGDDDEGDDDEGESDGFAFDDEQ